MAVITLTQNKLLDDWISRRAYAAVYLGHSPLRRVNVYFSVLNVCVVRPVKSDPTGISSWHLTRQ